MPDPFIKSSEEPHSSDEACLASDVVSDWRYSVVRNDSILGVGSGGAGAGLRSTPARGNHSAARAS